MEKNGAKKGVTLEMQAKEGLEQLKSRANTETANIKEKLRADREDTYI